MQVIKVHTVHVYDTSNEGKTAKKLLDKINKGKQLIKPVWQISLVTITSDASGESAKARWMACQSYPELLTPDCYSHQV